MSIPGTFMKRFATLLILVLFATGIVSAQKTINIRPVKKDTTDNQKKRLQNYYADTLFKFTPGNQKPTDPNELQAQDLYNEGSRLAKKGDYDAAIETFSRSIAVYENSNTYMKRGYSYMFKENYPMAIQDFTDALRLIPANKRALLGRGIARYELKDYSGAEADLKAYLDVDNTNAMAFNYMAAVCFMKQDAGCALTNYNEVARCDSTYPDLYTNRGMMRHYLRDFKGAVQDYDKAMQAKPGNPSSYNNRAAAYMMLGEFEPALQDLNKAIELNPTYSDAYDNRGRVKQRLGDLTGACQDWQKAWSMGLQTSRDLIIKYCK